LTAVDEHPPAPGVQFMAAWQAKQDGLEQPATGSSTPPPDRGPRPRYVAAAITDEAQQLAQTPKGARQERLNTAALKLGRLVGAGLASEEEVSAALYAASQTNGHVADDGARRIRGWISRGIRDGARTPRDPGQPTNSGSAPVRDLTEQLGAPPALVVVREPDPGPDLSAYLQPAGSWLSALPETPVPVWGRGDTILWAQGEALMIAGGPGLGKTNLAAQLVRARIGWAPAVLDLPVLEGERRLLYLMMDRPQQIARRLLQQFTRDELGKLDERMTLGVGPPPQDLARHPDLLPELCAAAGADTVVVDSLKDAALGLTDDEVGAGYNRARQLAVSAGVQVLELHHLVKRGADGKPPQSLADVYGSAWLTAGAGSVLLLHGAAGDPLVRAIHLKQPAEPWGPAELSHDHSQGTTALHHRVDLLELLAITTTQTARSAACQLFSTDKPKPAETERARRRLEQLVRAGHAIRREPAGTGRGEATYHPNTARELPAELTLENLED
jgi:hypothetical protein